MLEGNNIIIVFYCYCCIYTYNITLTPYTLPLKWLTWVTKGAFYNVPMWAQNFSTDRVVSKSYDVGNSAQFINIITYYNYNIKFITYYNYNITIFQFQFRRFLCTLKHCLQIFGIENGKSLNQSEKLKFPIRLTEPSRSQSKRFRQFWTGFYVNPLFPLFRLFWLKFSCFLSVKHGKC